ncbi:MAG: hypothetical protein CTY13_00155 [Methylobacter sp.]|nr:MAG: hypothetical protein CTY13_00155 [Methylobacter sp.]
MEAKLKKNTITHRYGLVVFCVGGLAAILSLVLSIDGLGPIDDHQFIRTIFQGKPFGFYIMPELGRFIPLAAQEYVLAATIIEPSPYIFHMIGGIKVILCGLLLFYCLILTRASNWAIAILWGIVIFSIGFANAAIRLQIGELNVLFLILVFVWSTLTSEKVTLPSASKQNIVAAIGLATLAVAFLYKELIFVFTIAFGASELLRHYRQTQTIIPRRIWALLVIGISYIVFYGLWRTIYVTGSYANFHSKAIWDIIRLYAVNDPFIIFIVLPLTAFRVLLFIRDANKQTVYDSFMVSASAYVGAYLALGMYNTYYLLPAYGFAVCGVAGILASQSAIRLNTIALIAAGFLGVNTLPIAVSDIQALKSIANNHYQFVRFLSEWLRTNPLPNSERRSLILEGVSPGNGIEVITSLKTFLESLGAKDSSFEVRSTETSDNKAISSYYGVKDEPIYTAKTGDLLIFNPYQQVVILPPLLAPSYIEVYRSGSEWALPRWTGWDWLKICSLSQYNCLSSISENMRYTGYAAMLVHRLAAPIQLAPLKSPSYRIEPVGLPSRMQAGITKKLDVLIENTGRETWPANGTSSPGMFVHLSYVWTNENGQVALEGNRSTFPEPMQPNDKAKISVFIKTPNQPGKYKLVISPVQEGVSWFYSKNATDIAKEIQLY